MARSHSSTRQAIRHYTLLGFVNLHSFDRCVCIDHSHAIFLLNMTIFQLGFHVPVEDVIRSNMPPAYAGILSIAVLAALCWQFLEF